MTNSLCLYPKGTLGQVFSQLGNTGKWWACEGAWRPHHCCEVGNSKLYDKEQHGEKLRIEEVCWSKKFGKKWHSLQPCSFRAADRHA